MSWTIITHDPKTLPPLDVPVFAAGGNLDVPRILVLCEEYNQNSYPIRVWCNPFGTIHFDEKKDKWTVDAEWDDDYNPVIWHPFPEVFACPKCGSVDVVHHADSSDETPVLTCPQCGHTGDA